MRFRSTLHVPAHGDPQPQRLHGQPAYHKAGAQPDIWKQDESRDRKEKSGRHHQQTRVFHVHAPFILFPVNSTGSGPGRIVEYTTPADSRE
jgi:hypothetical protein